jgi:hypothetical protein
MEQNEGLFLFEYLASYMIKLSIFFFIFEMMQVYIVLSSSDLTTLNYYKKLRGRLIYWVVGLETLALIFIEVINYIYFLVAKIKVKKGFSGIVYQVVKVGVLSIDLFMILTLWITFKRFIYMKKI